MTDARHLNRLAIPSYPATAQKFGLLANLFHNHRTVDNQIQLIWTRSPLFIPVAVDPIQLLSTESSLTQAQTDRLLRHHHHNLILTN